MIRNADYDKDHKNLLGLAKTSKYTKDFGSIMFSSPEAYSKGWVRGMFGSDDLPVAFTCRRDKVREPATVLYFINVYGAARGTGLGKQMLEDMMSLSPHRLLKLNCAKDNPAVEFYKKLGFRITGESLEGTGWAMEREYD